MRARFVGLGRGGKRYVTRTDTGVLLPIYRERESYTSDTVSPVRFAKNKYVGGSGYAKNGRSNVPPGYRRTENDRI